MDGFLAFIILILLISIAIAIGSYIGNDIKKQVNTKYLNDLCPRCFSRINLCVCMPR